MTKTDFYRQMRAVYEREVVLEALREREAAMLTHFGDTRCAAACMCPFHRAPGELFRSLTTPPSDAK